MVTALWETSLPVIPRAMLLAPAADGTAMDKIVPNLYFQFRLFPISHHESKLPLFWRHIYMEDSTSPSAEAVSRPREA
jgi:hypothetical protein